MESGGLRNLDTLTYLVRIEIARRTSGMILDAVRHGVTRNLKNCHNLVGVASLP
jgi:hypothetical protein